MATADAVKERPIPLFSVRNTATGERTTYHDRGKAYRACLAIRGDGFGPPVDLRLIRPRNAAKFLQAMLDARGLSCLTVWYQPNRCPGWMVSPNGRDEQSMSIIGSNFASAVEFIEGGTLDFIWGGKRLRSAQTP